MQVTDFVSVPYKKKILITFNCDVAFVVIRKGKLG